MIQHRKRRRSRFDTELLEGRTDVSSDRDRRDSEPVRDVARAQPLTQEIHDVPLTVRELDAFRPRQRDVPASCSVVNTSGSRLFPDGVGV